MDLNKVFLIGNLTRDPETRHTQSGQQVTNFTIAVNERSRGKQNETTMFIKVDCWGKTAELAAQYLIKGQEVLVEGRLKIEEYETREGQKRRDPAVTADRVNFGRKPREDGGGYGGGGGGDYQQRSSSPPERAQEPSYNYDEGPAPSGESSGSTEDDLPF